MRPDTAVILVVDDYSDMRDIIKATLSAMGVITILEAEDGLDALEILSSRPVNCVISDWKMPNLDGLGLLKVLRNDPKYLGISFMMMTGDVSRENIQEAISVGVNAFLAKPFTSTSLCEKVALLTEKAYIPSQKGIFKQEDIGNSSDKALVLIVDESSTCINDLSDKLKDEYGVKEAKNGEVALQLIKMRPEPAIVLIGVEIPDINSLEICRRLKADPMTEHIPVIFMAEQVYEDDISEALEIGAADYVSKQAGAMVLKAKIRMHLRLKQRCDELTQQVNNLMRQVMDLSSK